MTLIVQEDVRRRAELQKSLFPYWTLLGLSWVSWLHLAILTRTARYFVFALIYAPLYVIPLVALSATPPPATPGPPPPIAGLFGLVYIVGMIHVFRERRNLRVSFDEVPALIVTPAPSTPTESPARASTPGTVASPHAEGDPIRAQSGVVSSSSEGLRKKCGIDAEEDWTTARVIPIIPCVEDADGGNEVVAQWKRRSFLGQLMRLFNLLYDRRFYSAVTVFNDHFYITQTSLFFGLLPLFWVPRRTEVLRRHQVDDILQLVISRTDHETAAYDHLYASSGNRLTSNETFRLYVRASTAGNTIAKYVFKVANDTDSTPVSLEEALRHLHHLVPHAKHSAAPFTPGRREKISMAIRRKARAQSVIAWTCFTFAAFFAALTMATIAELTDPPDPAVALALTSGLMAVSGGFGWRALRLRNKLRTESGSLSQSARRHG